jgi:hypothetical protein
MVQPAGFTVVLDPNGQCDRRDGGFNCYEELVCEDKDGPFMSNESPCKLETQKCSCKPEPDTCQSDADCQGWRRCDVGVKVPRGSALKATLKLSHEGTNKCMSAFYVATKRYGDENNIALNRFRDELMEGLEAVGPTASGETETNSKCCDIQQIKEKAQEGATHNLWKDTKCRDVNKEGLALAWEDRSGIECGICSDGIVFDLPQNLERVELLEGVDAWAPSHPRLERTAVLRRASGSRSSLGADSLERALGQIEEILDDFAES